MISPPRLHSTLRGIEWNGRVLMLNAEDSELSPILEGPTSGSPFGKRDVLKVASLRGFASLLEEDDRGGG
jgi:hypothetical protein